MKQDVIKMNLQKLRNDILIKMTELSMTKSPEGK